MINFIKTIENSLKGRDYYTPAQLIKLGIYGSKTGVHKAIAKGEIESIYISERRVLILKDSILKHLKKLNEFDDGTEEQRKAPLERGVERKNGSKGQTA